MRRIFCSMMAVLVLTLLPGCAKKQDTQRDVPMLDRPFEATAIVRQKGMEFLVSFHHQPHSTQVKFEGPGSLKGLTMSFDAEKIQIDYEGLGFDFTPGGFPAQSAVGLVLAAIEGAAGEEVKASRQEEGLLLEGKLGEESFSLLLEGESGNILKLAIPQSELEMETLNFRFLP